MLKLIVSRELEQPCTLFCVLIKVGMKKNIGLGRRLAIHVPVAQCHHRLSPVSPGINLLLVSASGSSATWQGTPSTNARLSTKRKRLLVRRRNRPTTAAACHHG